MQEKVLEIINPNLKLNRFPKNINRSRQWIRKSGLSL